jgi:broad specificity phosphatase PhoE
MLKPGVTLYYIRHGETDWNLVRRYQGQRDIPLNATGRDQAARNGRALAELLGAQAAPLEYVASPLSRARETMEIVRRELGLPRSHFRTDDRLKEIHYGHWEGHLFDDVPAVDPEGFAARRADAWAWQPHGGESYSALSDRVGGWLRDIERDCVVVAHGGVSRALRGHIAGLSASDMFLLDVPQDRILVVNGFGFRWH